MKKVMSVLSATFLIMFVLPLAAFKMSDISNGLLSFTVIFLVVPLFSIVLGFHSGKDIKRRWYLPLISAALFLTAMLVSYGFKWNLTLTVAAVVLTVLGFGAMMFISRIRHMFIMKTTI